MGEVRMLLENNIILILTLRLNVFIQIVLDKSESQRKVLSLMIRNSWDAAEERCFTGVKVKEIKSHV